MLSARYTLLAAFLSVACDAPEQRQLTVSAVELSLRREAISILHPQH